jgi:hypothetical protein
MGKFEIGRGVWEKGVWEEVRGSVRLVRWGKLRRDGQSGDQGN